MMSKEVSLGKKLFLLVIMWVMIELSACGATELEERCFPMLALVDYDAEEKEFSFQAGFPRAGSSTGKEPTVSELQIDFSEAKTFKESKKGYEKHLNQVPDYNHMKVLVLDDDLLENENAYYEVLQTLAETEDFPRNTYVCVVDDVDDLIEIEENLPQDLGTYLEEYLNNHEKKKERMLTLGDLIDEMQNKEMTLYIPYHKPMERYVDWVGYYAIGEGTIFKSNE